MDTSSDQILSLEQLWELTVSRIKAISKPAYDSIFASVVPLEFDGKIVCLGVSDDFFAEILQNSYGDLLKEALAQASGTPLEFRLEAGHEVCRQAVETSAKPVEKQQVLPVSAPAVDNCHSKYTFENFVVGEENRYSYYCAQAVARKTGMYNPLYIFGGTGMGKTHLLQAVASDVRIHNPAAVIRYVPCETFLNAFVEASINKTHSTFRDYYRNVDFLLVDDVHILGGKSALQDEFFNTFNAIYNRGGQIILTSDKQPGEIKGLEARLVSRFQQGTVTQITSPSYETRLAILKLKQSTQSVKFPQWLIDFIAERVTSHIRALEGALMRMVSYCAAMSCSPEVITPEVAETLLGDILDSEAAAKRVDIDRILSTVADYYTLHVHDLVGTRRPKNIAEPRMTAMYLCRILTDFSLKEIGTAFGGRNHTTVIHAVKSVEDMMAKDEQFQRVVSSLKRKITSAG